MNLRCTYCQTPFTVGRLEKLAALQRMQAENLHHYDVFCPRCRRANSVSRQRLEIFTPGWQEGLRTLEADAAKVEKERVEPAPVVTKPASVPVETTRNRHAPRPVTAASAPVASTPSQKGKTAAKKTTVKKAVAKVTPSPKGKPAAKKPAKKSAPVAKKAAAKVVKKK
jgi:hypothetical protein